LGYIIILAVNLGWDYFAPSWRVGLRCRSCRILSFFSVIFRTDMSVSLFGFRKLLKTLLFHWHYTV